MACATPSTEPAGSAAKLTEIARYSIPEKTDFEGARVGGLSGLWYNRASDTYWSVSDDRGKYAGPRMYELAVKVHPADAKTKTSFEVIVKSVFPINEDEVPHGTGHGLAAAGVSIPEAGQAAGRKAAEPSKKKLRLTKNILDLEALAPLPWGQLLISSEGDYAKKPRTLPRLMEVKLDGTYVRDYEIPAEYLPEKTGRQTQGITNNNGFEGLTTLPSKDVLAAVESNLFQDPEDEVRWLRYSAPTAWNMKAVAEYVYPIPPIRSLGGRGISDIHALSEDVILVTEREFSMADGGMRFLVEFFLVDLREKTLVPPLAKGAKATTPKNTFTERYRLTKTKIGALSGKYLNIEAVELGPVVDGKPTLLMVVDNNFVKGSDSEFILMSLDGWERKK